MTSKDKGIKTMDRDREALRTELYEAAGSFLSEDTFPELPFSSENRIMTTRIYKGGMTVMARVSTKENKNIYHKTREELHLTREAASELLESLAPERIEKIENERCLPHPDEVLVMADKYKQPSLCNYYCANQCPIGQQYVPEVKIKDLSQIVLEMLASLNSMNKRKERLIEITADGMISEDELTDFIFIQKELERISITVETLQLWAERMLATGAIDARQYHACKERLETEEN